MSSWHPTSFVAHTAFSANGSLLLCSTARFQILVFNIAQNQCVLNLDFGFTVAYNTRGLKAIFTPDSLKVIVSLPDGDIGVYDIASGDLLKRLTGNGCRVWNFLASPDGETFASVSINGTEDWVTIWDMSLERSTPISEFCIGEGPSDRIMFSANSQYLATSDYYSVPRKHETVAFWECATGALKYLGNRYSDVLLTPAMITNDGQPVMDTEDGDSPRYLSCSHDCKWIVRDGLPVIRLPPNYRTGRDYVAATDTSVVIGCNSGHVLFFGFDRDSTTK